MKVSEFEAEIIEKLADGPKTLSQLMCGYEVSETDRFHDRLDSLYHRGWLYWNGSPSKYYLTYLGKMRCELMKEIDKC